MRAEIIAVGTEILLGHIINTNTAYLAKKLAEAGIDLYYHTTVGDNPERLASAVKNALSRSHLVFTIGGLGPTVDDVTLSSVSKALSVDLIYNKEVEGYIKRFFKKRGMKRVPKGALKQAYVPAGARCFENKFGTAAAIAMEYGGKIIIALPGPPAELEPLVDNEIMPYLKKRGVSGTSTIKTRTLRAVGLIESDVNNALKDLLAMGPRTTVGIYTSAGEAEVHLKITAKAGNDRAAGGEIQKIEKEIRKRLKNHVYGADLETLEYAVGRMLAGRKKTIAVAESCTGGLIASRITDVSGSSAYFTLGVVAYSDEAKTKLLGIAPGLLKKYGAVSKEAALAMASGVKEMSGSDIAVGVTGIAGPTGGTKKKPVGLVYVAVISAKMKMVKECRFVGSRDTVKLRSSTTALDLARAVCAHS